MAAGVGREIRLCWCEVEVGESGVQRSSPWELAAALRRSGFTYVSVLPAQLQTAFLQHRMLNATFFYSLHNAVGFLCSISPSGLNCVPEVYI